MAAVKLGLNIFKKSPVGYRLSPVYKLLTRTASSGGPTPPIKPPGPEWVDQKWKDDGTGYGDYPNWAEWSYQNRDPHGDYFDKQDRRYYGEPVHVNDDILNMWMPDDHSEYKYSQKEMLLHLTIALGLLGGIVWYSEYVYDGASRDPAVAKPYPYNNLYIERGGDPDKEPTEEDLKKRIPRPHYGW